MKNRRNRNRKPQRRSRSAAELGVDPGFEIQAAHGSFQGAAVGDIDRGYVYLPTLDTLKEVDQWSHLELLRRGRFIYNSGGGLVHRGVNGVARMVAGTGLFPYPMSEDKKWNQQVRLLWGRRCGSKNLFDLSGKFSISAAQRAIVRSQIVGGDVAPTLARSDTDRLCCMIYEAHQVGQGSTRVDPSEHWHHGVRLGRHKQPISYRILGYDHAEEKQHHVDVPAENVLFCANYERIGQVRGLSRFYPVINKVLDRGEIHSALTKGIKKRAMVGYAIEQQMQSSGVAKTGRGGLAPLPETQVKGANGQTMTLEKFFGGGRTEELKPGQSFKTVESNHPSEGVREHLETLHRDISWAIGYSPEVLWNITQLGGAGTRFIMADTQGQIEEEQQQLIEQFLGPWYFVWIRDCIEAGDLWEVKDWDIHSWLLPKRLTVDFGRDGKLHIEQAKRGMITLKSLYGAVSQQWKVEIDQYLDERQYIKEGLTANGRNLTWSEAFPEIKAPNDAAPTAPSKSSGTDPDTVENMALQVEEIHERVMAAADNPPKL